jgi:DNA polymerase III epsilon subunit-like protein
LIIVCDIESTSLNVFEAEIVTGFFACLNDKLQIVNTLSIQSRPWKWSHEAEKIHGISEKEASKYKKFSEVYHEIISFLRMNDATEFWCHSNVKMYGKIVPYDYAVLRMQMLNMGDEAYFAINKLKSYSTHSLAKVLHDRFTFESNSLDNICRTLGIKLTHHNAESDCRATVEIIKRLLPMTNREELYNYERGINEDSKKTSRRNSRTPIRLSGAIGFVSNH